MKLQAREEQIRVGKLLNVEVYVRSDLTVVKASEQFYRYVGEYSYLPISDLIYPEDAKELKAAVAQLDEPAEFVTGITNRVEGYRSIYLRLENCDETELGQKIWRIVIYDYLSMEKEFGKYSQRVAKYRQMFGLLNYYYFDYQYATNQITIYKYVNEKSMVLYKMDLEAFVEEMLIKYENTEQQKESLAVFCNYLKQRTPAFEMEFIVYQHGEQQGYCVKGATLYKNDEFSVGIMIPNFGNTETEYYMTPAAKDVGSGLMNKRAAMEYAIQRLNLNDNKPRWFVMMDIDDFKNINDNFGHLFGDEVIRKVAYTLQATIGYRGIVGRFGGDEYFAMLEDVPTRADLKTLLKTITKQLFVVYDPKLQITMSIGVSQYPEDGDTYEELLGKADMALYIAKNKGKNRHIIYAPEKHGDYRKDSVKMQSVSFALSKEKRHEALVEVMSNICTNGLCYITEHQENLNTLINIFDLDGISIYTDGGKKLVCRNGAYAYEASDISETMENPAFQALFGTSDTLSDGNINKLKANCPHAYEMAVKQEIGGTFQCMGRRDGVPYSLVCFDVFNRTRKWSETEKEMQSLLGHCICRLLEKQGAL